MINKFDKKLKEIIVECKDGIDITKIDEQIDLVRDFGFDSINIIQLIVQIESEFDIEIGDEDLILARLSPYKNLVEILNKKLGEELLC